MAEIEFESSVDCPVSARETFDWHLRPGALRRLLPPWDKVRIASGSGPEERLEKGARTVIEVKTGPIWTAWHAEIADVQADKTFFVDRQLKGPFKTWIHRHAVQTKGKTESKLTDSIRYELPMGPLGAFFGKPFVRSKLTRMFAWRHRVMVHDLEAHLRAKSAGVSEPMTVAITGASGLVGRSLAAFLRTGGHRVLELVRREAKAPHEVRWDPLGGTVDTAALEGIDAVVHLAGESIFGFRWSDAKKERITASRIQGTRTLVNAIASMERPPRTLVAASAIGLYGDRGDEELREDAPMGTGFLAETCAAWEAEVDGVPEGVRAVKMRLGVVLDPGGGALKTMMPAFKLGGGGRLASGKQWFPWIVLDDVIGAFHHALTRSDVCGPVNVVAPGALRNTEFTKVLGGVLRRPTILPAPRFGLRLALGKQQADEMLLASVRVVPERLLDTGFPFRYPELEAGLKHALGLAR